MLETQLLSIKGLLQFRRTKGEPSTVRHADAKVLQPHMAEYIDKVLADNLKREVDQEENVVRSLPLFATAIGALLALLGLTIKPLAGADWYWLSIIAHILALGIVVCVLAIGWMIRRATVRQAQPQLMAEWELIEYAERLTRHFQEEGRRLNSTSTSDVERRQRALDPLKSTSAAWKKAMARDVISRTAEPPEKQAHAVIRGFMQVDTVNYTQTLRLINLNRMAWRAWMFWTLSIAVTLAVFLACAIVFLERATLAKGDRDDRQPRTAASQPPANDVGQARQAGATDDNAGTGASGSAAGHDDAAEARQDGKVRTDSGRGPGDGPPPSGDIRIRPGGERRGVGEAGAGAPAGEGDSDGTGRQGAEARKPAEGAEDDPGAVGIEGLITGSGTARPAPPQEEHQHVPIATPSPSTDADTATPADSLEGRGAAPGTGDGRP